MFGPDILDVHPDKLCKKLIAKIVMLGPFKITTLK
jgi:hypothetical protein